MENQIMDLIVRIDKIESKTFIKEELGKILLNYTNEKNSNNLNIQDNKACCIPSVCSSNCGSCYINNNLNLPEIDPKKCCVIS
jgi:hypothetical protein